MTATADRATSTTEEAKKKPPRDPAREVVETVVFVVVLVLLLKLFVTEAFVIPTGSMATTLYGYQKIVTCPKCGHVFPVNSHEEAEGAAPNGNPNGPKVRQALVKYVCPNCRHHGLMSELSPWPDNESGDRVLVLKPLFHLRPPRRGDVVVFKFPEGPQQQHTAQNYIKRAMGLGGETVAIHGGDLYVTTSLSYPATDPRFPRPADPDDLWRGDPDHGPDYRYRNSAHATDLFAASRAAGFPAGKGGFEIVRKGEDHLLADRRIVWDNDQQPKELAGRVPPRWHVPAAADGAGWKGDDPKQPTAFAHSGDAPGAIRYRHLPMQWKTAPDDRLDPTPATDFKELAAQKPALVENFLAYNASRQSDPAERMWVGDLILECEAEVAAGAEVVLELSKGVNRFQARFGGGQVTLARTGPKAAEFGTPSRPCKVSAGTYQLRFANVDARLAVWVNGDMIDFGTEGDYNPAAPDTFDPDDTQKEGWTRANDIAAPASVGATGQVSVRHLKLFRDIYYTWGGGKTGDQTEADTYYVQPGHYMCMGDNSSHSSDSRKWGMVPERLMLGKAVFVFYPVSLDWKLGWPPVRLNPNRNRAGFIK